MIDNVLRQSRQKGCRPTLLVVCTKDDSADSMEYESAQTHCARLHCSVTRHLFRSRPKIERDSLQSFHFCMAPGVILRPEYGVRTFSYHLAVQDNDSADGQIATILRGSCELYGPIKVPKVLIG